MFPLKHPSFRNLFAPRYIAAMAIGAVVDTYLVVASHESLELRLLTHFNPYLGDVQSPLNDGMRSRANLLALLLAFLDVGLQGAGIGIVVALILVIVFDALRKTVLRRFGAITAILIYLVSSVLLGLPLLGLAVRASITSFYERMAAYPAVDVIRTVSREGLSQVNLPAAGGYKVYFGVRRPNSLSNEVSATDLAVCSLTNLTRERIELRPISFNTGTEEMNYIGAYDFTVAQDQPVLLTCKYKRLQPIIVFVPDGVSVDGPMNSVGWRYAALDIKKGVTLTQLMTDSGGRDFAPTLSIPRDAVDEYLDLDKAHWIARRDIQAGEPILWRDFDKPLNTTQ
jgi:hypothetical protein